MSSARPAPVSEAVHRRCEKCGDVQRTRAKKAWKCYNCGHRNKVEKAKVAKPQEARKYIPGRITF